jgi:hypothetical protein
MLTIKIYKKAEALLKPINEKIKAKVKENAEKMKFTITYDAYYGNALSRLSRAYAILNKILEAGENKEDLKDALDIAKLELKEFE